MVLAVELRPEESRRSRQNLVGPLEFSDLLLEILDPRRRRSADPGNVPVIDVGLAHPRTAPTRSRTRVGERPSARSRDRCPTPQTPSAPQTPSPPGCTSASSASVAAVPSAWLHPRFQVRSLHHFQGDSVMGVLQRFGDRREGLKRLHQLHHLQASSDCALRQDHQAQSDIVFVRKLGN
jgi:hypothetical protein